jgi:hypothetical protein
MFPVRFEQAPILVDPIAEADVRKVPGAAIWLVDYYEKAGGKHNRRKKTAKVQQERSGLFTCSCRKWMRKRNRNCEHIVKIKRMQGLSVPFAQTRRRGPTYIFFPDGTPVYETRLEHARVAMPKNLPRLIEAFCHLYIQEPEHATSGAIGIPEKVQAYALLIKVALNLSREQLQCWLEEHMDPLYRLGWNKSNPPSFKALGERYGKLDGVDTALEKMASEAAATFSNMDDGFMGDSFDTTNVQVQNSRDLKFGPAQPSYRSKRPLLRTHFVEGNISGAIYAFDITESVGPGSGDSTHLPPMVTRAKTIVPQATWATFDQGYPSYRNFECADALALDLFIRPKSHENRLNGEWPAGAERLARMENEEPEKYDERARMRPKTERTPKRIKDFASRIRLRRRKCDPYVVFPELKRTLGEQPDEVIQAVHELAFQNVGVARRKECKAIIAVANLRCIITWTYVLQQWVDHGGGGKFSAIPTLRAQDLISKAS